MLCYKMSLALLQSVEVYIESMIDGLKKNDDEMAKNKSDIEKINVEIKALKAFDVKEEKEEVEIREDIKDIQQKIAALKAKIALQDAINAEDHDITDAAINDLEVSDALQVVIDLEAAVVIDDLQAEIMALRAEIMALKTKLGLHETINSEDNEIINHEIDGLQEDVKVLQDNNKKEEADKAAMLAAEIATLEAQLKKLTMALNVVKPATHPELFLGASEGQVVEATTGVFPAAALKGPDAATYDPDERLPIVQ